MSLIKKTEFPFFDFPIFRYSPKRHTGRTTKGSCFCGLKLRTCLFKQCCVQPHALLESSSHCSHPFLCWRSLVVDKRPCCCCVCKCFFLFFFRNYFKGPQCHPKYDAKDKTAIVTGANSGIGKEIAKELASRGKRTDCGWCGEIKQVKRTSCYSSE